MRNYKLRGHKRKWKEIEDWIERSKNLDTDRLSNTERDYTKIYIHPWSGLSLINSQTPEPKGQTKARILNGLIDIYESWKENLEKHGKPYYLKIWIFEPRFAKSQVVCAIGDQKDFYLNSFSSSKIPKKINLGLYGSLAKKLEEFNWEYRLDEDHYDESEPDAPELYVSIKDYEWDVRHYKKLFRKPHRVTDYGKGTEHSGQMYSFERGGVWIGEK